ncbi:2OG-Fe(II) oxygenase family protein [Candidatus Pelagibacter sp.]|nr:2OG-Fe(II) oxygenase family protein [Candidatus Pelagibacter sp.]
MDVELLQPFGPSILKTKIPQEIMEKLNIYIDQVVIDKKKSDLLNMGNKLAGDVTQEFKLEKDFMNNIGFLKFIGINVSQWIQISLKQKITKFSLIDSWIVRQFKDEYNPVHWHGGHVSGAGFLKIPKSFGSHVQNKEKTIYEGGTLNFLHGSRQFMSNSKFRITPEIGDLYIFPHYLMHTVYPFKGTDEERRSISFNGLIDENIFNVHG